jgi:hypothetical protein
LWFRITSVDGACVCDVQALEAHENVSAETLINTIVCLQHLRKSPEIIAKVFAFVCLAICLLEPSSLCPNVSCALNHALVILLLSLFVFAFMCVRVCA